MGLLSSLSKAASTALGIAGGPIGQAVGLGLEFAGGLKNAFGRGAPSYGPGKQSYEQLMGAFRAADKAGLHRLAVAGSPAGYSPAPMSEANGLLAAGQALRSGPSAKEKELLDAQIEEARSRTILNQANARRALLGPQPGLGGASSRLIDALSAHTNRLGGARGVEVVPERDVPLTNTVNAGRATMNSPNEEAFSVGLDELVIGMLIYGPQYAARGIRWLSENAPKIEEPKSRAGARRAASSRNRRAQESDYLFPRR